MSNVNVMPQQEGGWQVKRDNAKRAIVRTDTQRQAIDIARPISRISGDELVIRRPDGRIREKDSHGRDPFPPKG